MHLIECNVRIQWLLGELISDVNLGGSIFSDKNEVEDNLDRRYLGRDGVFPTKYELKSGQRQHEEDWPWCFWYESEVLVLVK